MKRIFLILMSLSFIAANNLLSQPIREVNNANEFKSMINSNDYVMVEFYSPDCPHCKNFARTGIYEKLADELTSVLFCKCSNGMIGQSYGVRGVPAFIMFKNGKKVGEAPGRSKDQLKNFIQQSIK